MNQNNSETNKFYTGDRLKLFIPPPYRGRLYGEYLRLSYLIILQYYIAYGEFRVADIVGAGIPSPGKHARREARPEGMHAPQGIAALREIRKKTLSKAQGCHPASFGRGWHPIARDARPAGDYSLEGWKEGRKKKSLSKA